MEIVANVWPVVDSNTGIILRYFIRAYVMDAPDEVISETLQALAPLDFRLGSHFVIPSRFSVVSEHGKLNGAVIPRDFYANQSEILEAAFAELERAAAPLQGITSSGSLAEVRNVVEQPRFSPEPYLLITSLIEMPDGQLVPNIRS